MNSPCPFLPPADPRLWQVAAAVKPDAIASDDIQNLINRMLDITQAKQSDNQKRVLVGLAASQIGIGQRVVLTDTAADGHGGTGRLEVLINPEIIWQSSHLGDWYEGCYSTGPICGIVSRPDAIKVMSLDRQGRPQTHEFKGYTARVLQHEIDHLNGQVFIARITNPDHLHWVNDDEFAAYRDQEQWRHWPRKATFAQWEAMKQQGTSL